MSRFGFVVLCLIGYVHPLTSIAYSQENSPVFQVIGQEPYSFLTKEGSYAGYHYEIANSILKEAGYAAVAKPAPLKRMIHNLKEGFSDCFLAANSPFAKKHFTAVQEIGHDLQVGILPRDGINLNRYEDLKGLKVAVPQGMTIGEPFDSDASITKVSTPDYNQSALMLKYQRIDAIMGALESIRYSAYKALPNEPLHFGKALITQSYPVALICNKGKIGSDVVNRLKSATERLKTKGEIQKIITSFFMNLIAS